MEKLILFFKDDSGATAVEYALLAVFIAVVIVGAVTLLGERLVQMFQAASGIFG